VGFGDEQAEQIERPELLPQIGGIADRMVLHLAHDGRRRVLGEQAAHDLAEHLLLLGEGEIKHGRSFCASGHPAVAGAAPRVVVG
jgi:hypothetical protein